MSRRFVLTIIISFVLVLASLVVFILLRQGWLFSWLRWVWGPLFILCVGVDASLRGRLFDPSEPALGVLIGLGANLLIALVYKGITLL